MHHPRCSAALVAAAIIGTACASGGAGSSSRGSRSLITREQLADVMVADAYEAVNRLRPTWFRIRGAPTGQGRAPIAVFVDGVRAGDVEFLRTVRTADIEELHYISASDATTRWGTGYPSGAIEIIRRRPQ